MTEPQYLGTVVPFLFTSDQPVRTIEHDSKAWFALADLCAILAIKNPWRATSRLDDDEFTTAKVSTPGGEQTMTVVNRPGMYHLVLTSNRPEATTLRRWITHEVLPAIEETGHYSTPQFQEDLDLATLSIETAMRATATNCARLPDGKRKDSVMRSLAFLEEKVSTTVKLMGTKKDPDYDYNEEWPEELEQAIKNR